MLKDSKAFSGFSVKDLAAAKIFYGDILGLEVRRDTMGLTISIAGANPIFVYQKDDHAPATFTILNFPVDNIDEAVAALKAKGVTFQQYPHMTDTDGIARGRAADQGPDIAWFTDPDGNVLSVLH